MNTRQLYRSVIFAAGWLLAIGFLFQQGFGNVVRRSFLGAESRLERAGQAISDLAGRTVDDARRGSRSDELAPMRAELSAEALRHPRQLLFGAFDGLFPASFTGLDGLEQALAYRFPILSFYQAWGDHPDEQTFPLRMAETIDRLGSVPLITWEPWVKDFDSALRPNLPAAEAREYACLAAVARGDYDFYIVPWAAEAAKFGKPLLLRFAHEMNDPYRYPWGPQNGNRPDDFIAAWRHVHAIFAKMNATNVLWVWSPHISMPWFEYYYPGDAFVDWVATGVLNYGDVAPWSRWWSFDQIFGKAYPTLAKLGKPIMISEFGTLASGGDPVDWLGDAYSSIDERYPQIRALVFFNQTSDVTLSTAPLDWSVGQSRPAVVRTREMLRRHTAARGPHPS